MNQVKVTHITTVDTSLRYLLLNQLCNLQQSGYQVRGISAHGANLQWHFSSRHCAGQPTRRGQKITWTGGWRVIIGNIGNLHPRKRHRYLVSVLQRLVTSGHDVCMVVGRDDKSGKGMRSLATALGVNDHVVWAGFRPDARALLDAFDIFVLPSDFERLPVVLIEAMDAALPIVATAVGGNPEIVENGVIGLLVP